MSRSTQTAEAPAGEHPAPGPGATKQSPRRPWWLVPGALAVTGVLGVVGVVVVTAGREPAPSSAPVGAPTGPIVGGDLHTIADLDGALLVGGHTAAAISRDGGATWEEVPSLTNGDPMAWAVSGDAILVGGHPGLFRSVDDGETFELGQVAGASDVHALGASGSIAYLASPEAGLLASADGGETWELRSSDAGQSFMGTILVDPEDPDRLIAPDMTAGVVASADGGLTWRSLGGPQGVMSVTVDPADRNQLVAVGMEGAAISSDGGASWQDLVVPPATSAVTFSSDGASLYAAALRGVQADVYRSSEGGATWEPTM